MSSTGMTYAQHFCGGYKMLSKITLSEASLSCGMTMSLDLCDQNEAEDDDHQDQEKKHGCCDTTYTKIVVDDNFSPSYLDIDIPIVFIPVVPISFSVENEVVVASSDENEYFKYRPPPLWRDIQVLYETFLI